MRWVPFTVVMCLPSAALAQSTRLYGVNQTELVVIDHGSAGPVHVVGPLGLPADMLPGSIAYHPVRERFYGTAFVGITATNRDYSLLEIDPATGAATVVGLIMNSRFAPSGHVESIEYIDSLGELVISHSDSGQNDFTSDNYRTISPDDASLVFLSKSTLDTDVLIYNSGFDILYSLDPNGSDWALVDLSDGSSAFAGSAIDTLADGAFEPGLFKNFSIDFNDNTLYRFDISMDGLSVAPGDALGAVIASSLVRGLAFAPASFCPGDANGDGAVNFADITSALENWLTVYDPGTGPGDADGSGTVNFGDITNVLENWLAACP